MHDDCDSQEEGPVGAGDCLIADASVAGVCEVGRSRVDPLHDWCCVFIKIEVAEENLSKMQKNSIHRQCDPECLGCQL